MAMRFMLYLVLCAAAVVFAAEPQTKAKSQTKAPPQTKAGPQAKEETGPVQGFAAAPMVLADEGCARDYVRAFQFEGIELRKKLTDLEAYKCVDTTAKGIFAAVSTDRKDFAVEKGKVAYFRRVTMTYDRQRTQLAVGNTLVNYPGSPVYIGWIADADFYAVSPEQFDQLLAEKKIPMLMFGNTR